VKYSIEQYNVSPVTSFLKRTNLRLQSTWIVYGLFGSLVCSERRVPLAGCWFVLREKYCWLVDRLLVGYFSSFPLSLHHIKYAKIDMFGILNVDEIKN
jgi:hypothetical protein